MSRATVAAGPAQRWKLELPGTSAIQTRDLEAAVVDAAEDAGWTLLQVRTEASVGVVRVYIATGPEETAERIALELSERMQYRLPTIGRLEPTTWEAVASSYRARKDARHKHSRSRTVLPKSD